MMVVKLKLLLLMMMIAVIVWQAGLDGASVCRALVPPVCLPLPLPLFATAIARRTKGQSGKVVCTYI